MGRAATALGAPESNSGILDGSVTGTHLVNTESGRSPSFGVDRVSQTLSQPEASEPTSQQHSHEAEQEVAQRQLWFQLSLEERARFGSCFSRMLLKCLSDAEQAEQEVRI